MSSKGETINYWELVKINFIGCYFNLFLPSSFGGDVVRAIYLNKTIDSWKYSTSSVILDRFIGLLSLFFLAFCSLVIKILIGKTDNHIIAKLLIIATVCMFIGWILLLNLHHIIKKMVSVKNKLLQKFIIKYEAFSEGLNIMNYPKHTIRTGFVVSTIGNILTIIALYFVVLSLGLQIGILTLLIVFPLVSVISMIPISLGGIGIRESAFVFLLSDYSVSTINAVAISVLYFSSIVFLGIIGGIIFSLSKYSVEKIKP